MNDAGLDEDIVDASVEVRRAYTQNVDGRTESKNNHEGTTQDHLKSRPLSHQPQSPAYSSPKQDSVDKSYTVSTLWWYASTGFPLITGTFGPMANAFSICALVEQWREDLLPGETESSGTSIPDPTWLITVNAVSLALALIANISLLLNMARRLRFSIAQPITIIGFWLSSVLLIVLISIASYNFQAPGVQNQVLSQAYYYACWAAGIYQIISYLMCVTVYGAVTKKYDSQFNLNMAQRTLMLQTIAYFTYLLLGALVYSKIEGWRYLDAIYWADFTLLTVGIGDIAPTTHVGRGLIFPFAIGGIVILGLVVSSIRSLVLDRGKKKVSARMTEKLRRRVVRKAQELHDSGKSRRRRGTGLKDDLMEHISQGPQEDPREELRRRQAEFESMRMVQHMSNRRQKWMNLLLSTTAFGFLWFIGALVFWKTERREQQWTYFQSLYFSYTSLLTIGYGDFSPVSNSGKPFFVFWSLLAIPTLTILISDMGDTVVKTIKDLTIWLGEISILPSDEGSILERLEYGLSKAVSRRPELHRKQGKGTSEGNGDDGDEDSSSSDDDHPFAIAHLPFLIDIFKKDNSQKKGQAMNDRLAKDFEQAEREDEQVAREKGDTVAEDEHHYRHLLLTQIRKVYADTAIKPPKKYSYKEWALFLTLLGEDESSSEFHRTARVKRRKSSTTEANTGDDKDTLESWSWIGPQSPLLSDKHEPALLLELLFQRLEESLGGKNKHKERAIQQNSRREQEVSQEEDNQHPTFQETDEKHPDSGP